MKMKEEKVAIYNELRTDVEGAGGVYSIQVEIK